MKEVPVRPETDLPEPGRGPSEHRVQSGLVRQAQARLYVHVAAGVHPADARRGPRPRQVRPSLGVCALEVVGGTTPDVGHRVRRSDAQRLEVEPDLSKGIECQYSGLPDEANV